jgi:hypothetical protein
VTAVFNGLLTSLVDQETGRVPMNVNVAELMDALPVVEPDESTISDSVVQEALAAGLSNRPLPVGAVHRLFLLGGLQAKIAVAYGFHWMFGWFQNADQRERDLAETHFKAAVKLLDSMGYLRGAVMKVGQTLAHFPGRRPRRARADAGTIALPGTTDALFAVA